MKSRVRLLIILALAGVATVGIYAAASATANPCGDTGIVIDSSGIAIKKNANCEGQRDWSWTIKKSASPSSLTLAAGQQSSADYTVEVHATSTGTYTVWGQIVVRNTNTDGDPITITDVTDSLPAPVVCDVALPHALPPSPDPYNPLPESAIHCTYSATLDSQPTSNTATVTYVGGEASATTALDWANVPIDETDECITVDDSLAGSLGTVCGDHTFTYSRTVGPYQTCGSYKVENTATFTTNDTQTQDSSTATVDVNVPCDGGCTLTPGYWKTHSINGPAPYDDTWAMIGEGTTFFHSGMSYYDVLWTSPSGNAYYILAHAYIAAKLNGLNDADLSPVQSAFDDATALFADPANTPDAVGDLKGSQRNVWISLASTLDDYNNGLIGPGHCSE